jgi:phage anti-repressor protein
MIKINENNKVNAKDIYSFVEVKTRFNDWVRNCIDYADLQEGKDFILNLSKSTGGRPAIEYEFTLDAAKEVCIVSATSKAKELRRWLIGLSNQVENFDLLTHDQVVYLSILKGFFKYFENQKKYFKEHTDKYANEHINSKNAYAEFHIWRNKALEIDKEILDAKIKEYCIEKNTRLPKISTNQDKIRFLSEYDSLRNAVWDFLSIKGEVNAKKLADLVKRMAMADNLVFYEKNENNLFQSKENIELPKQLK